MGRRGRRGRRGRGAAEKDEVEEEEEEAKTKRPNAKPNKTEACPTDKQKPEPTKKVTARFLKQMKFLWGTNQQHIQRYGPNHNIKDCFRCRWIHKLRDSVLARHTYTDVNGTVGSWVEEVCRPNHLWGLGCLVCRQQKEAGVKGCRSRGFRDGALHEYSTWRFRRHETSEQHIGALRWLREATWHEGCVVVSSERGDVPPIKHFMQVYSAVKRGKAYTAIAGDFLSADRAGGTLAQAWRSRRCSTQMVESMAQVLKRR